MFLDTLARTGVWAAACRAASPHSPDNTSNPPCSSSFRSLMQRDLSFASEVEAATEQAKAAVLLEIQRRGQEGWEEPIFQKGQRAVDHDGKPASVRKFSDNLLLARARSLMPELFSEKHVHEHNVNVTTGRQGYWTITEEDTHCLTDAEVDQLLSIMGKVRERRQGMASIEHQPAEVLDADFTEVEDDAPEVWELAYKEKTG